MWTFATVEDIKHIPYQVDMAGENCQKYLLQRKGNSVFIYVVKGAMWGYNVLNISPSKLEKEAVTNLGNINDIGVAEEVEEDGKNERELEERRSC